MQTGRKAAADIDRLVAQNVRRLRAERGMTSAALGTALGVTYQQYQKYEIGANRLTAGRLALLADALGVEPASLFEGHEGPAPVQDRLRTELGKLYARLRSRAHREALVALARKLTEDEEGARCEERDDGCVHTGDRSRRSRPALRRHR